ncbi:Hypothetical predicted protein [Octopus vulgaris]|uniref:Uncharacterized protein n=2 Tax=Octopus TaxID=6643 RepID=A0AA36FIP7_OCTVU|nr:Hypothetical predicted protein [Octopus vulgaris]
MMFSHMAMYESDEESDFSESGDEEMINYSELDAPAVRDRINLFEMGSVSHIQTPIMKRRPSGSPDFSSFQQATDVSGSLLAFNDDEEGNSTDLRSVLKRSGNLEALLYEDGILE